MVPTHAVRTYLLLCFAANDVCTSAVNAIGGRKSFHLPLFIKITEGCSVTDICIALYGPTNKLSEIGQIGSNFNSMAKCYTTIRITLIIKKGLSIKPIYFPYPKEISTILNGKFQRTFMNSKKSPLWY